MAINTSLPGRVDALRVKLENSTIEQSDDKTIESLKQNQRFLELQIEDLLKDVEEIRQGREKERREKEEYRKKLRELEAAISGGGDGAEGSKKLEKSACLGRDKPETPPPQVLASTSMEVDKVEDLGKPDLTKNFKEDVTIKNDVTGSKDVSPSAKSLGKRRERSVDVPSSSKRVKTPRVKSPSPHGAPALLPKAEPDEPKTLLPLPTPKFKFKEDAALVLPPDVVAAYLKNAPRYAITPKPSEVHVPRKFMRLAYGGSDQQLLQFIEPERNPSGERLRRLIFPMPDMNPAMPLHPGDSGLLFASRHEVLVNPPWGVFRRHLNGKDAVWLYLGEYESELVGKMTAQQFRDQRASVQGSWAKSILKERRQDCYMAMRARISLRKGGRLPIDDKEAAKAKVDGEVAKIRDGRGAKVYPEDVIKAFSQGDEGIDIIRMRCVAYDHIFSGDIESVFPRYKNGRIEEEGNVSDSPSLWGAQARRAAQRPQRRSGRKTRKCERREPYGIASSSQTRSTEEEEQKLESEGEQAVLDLAPDGFDRYLSYVSDESELTELTDSDDES